MEKQTPSTVANRITKSKSQERRPEPQDVEMSTEEDTTPQTPQKLTYIIENTDSPDYDNVDKDPDWRKTPLAKRLISVNRMRPVISKCFCVVSDEKMTFFLADNEDEPTKPIKRTSEGGCTCRKNCSTRTCGCRKNSKQCGHSCKCSVENCANRSDRDSGDVSLFLVV